MKIMKVKQEDGSIVSIPLGKGADGKSAYEYAKEGGYTGTEAQFSALLANAVDKRKITLGLHTDGLIYLFIDNVPVGNGIALPSGGVSGDVVGNVDSAKNIVLSGNLADGTYTVKYEMEDGTVIDIGEMVLDSNTYYSVSNNLTNCTNGNNATSIVESGSYSATISANEGCELSSITVTMGGTDITSSVVSGGNISIVSVTGNIIITAVAVTENLADPTSADWLVGSRYSVSAQSINNDAVDTTHITNYIPVKKGDVISFDSTIYFSSNTYGQFAGNANKEKLLIAKISDGGSYWQYENNVITVLHDDVKFMRFNLINVPDKNAVTIKLNETV